MQSKKEEIKIDNKIKLSDKGKDTKLLPKDKIDPFRMLLLGRSGVGKTYNGLKWALKLIKEKHFKPRRVVIISKTWKSDPSQEDLIKYCSSKYDGFKKNNCFEDVDLEFLKKLFESQKLIKDTDQKQLSNWLVIFDDQISNNLIKRQNKDPTLKNLFCVGRHYNISQIWMLQRFKATIDPTCRDQFTNIAIFKQGNKVALKELLQDYDESPNLNHKESLEELVTYYQDAVAQDDDHGCLVINALVSYGKGRLQQGLLNDIYFDK